MTTIPIDASLRRVVDNFVYRTPRYGRHTGLPERVLGVVRRRVLRGEYVDSDSVFLLARRIESPVSYGLPDNPNPLMTDVFNAFEYAQMMMDIKSLTPEQQAAICRLRKAYLKHHVEQLPDGLSPEQIENLTLLGNLYGKGLLD